MVMGMLVSKSLCISDKDVRVRHPARHVGGL